MLIDSLDTGNAGVAANGVKGASYHAGTRQRKPSGKAECLRRRWNKNAISGGSHRRTLEWASTTRTCVSRPHTGCRKIAWAYYSDQETGPRGPRWLRSGMRAAHTGSDFSDLEVAYRKNRPNDPTSIPSAIVPTSMHTTFRDIDIGSCPRRRDARNHLGHGGTHFAANRIYAAPTVRTPANFVPGGTSEEMPGPHSVAQKHSSRVLPRVKEGFGIGACGLAYMSWRFPPEHLKAVTAGAATNQLQLPLVFLLVLHTKRRSVSRLDLIS